MDIFNRGRGRDRSLTDRGKQLVPAARVYAVSAYASARTLFPSIESVESERWDFILSVAGISVGISQLNHEILTENVKDAARDATTQAAVEWNPMAVEAVEDCTGFVDRTYDGLRVLPEYTAHREFLFSDSLGSWVVWNVFGHAPESDEERQLVRVLGGMVVHAFISWWKGS